MKKIISIARTHIPGKPLKLYVPAYTPIIFTVVGVKYGVATLKFHSGIVSQIASLVHSFLIPGETNFDDYVSGIWAINLIYADVKMVQIQKDVPVEKLVHLFNLVYQNPECYPIVNGYIEVYPAP